VLVVSLASEGFFTGYQAFRLHTPCVFCLIVFGFIVALGVIRLLQREWVVMMGFGSLAAVFCLFYLVLPVGATNPIPGDKELVLFYGKDCKYCAEVLKVLDEKNIPVEHVLVNEYAAMLKNMGIEHVPTLYVNYKNEKVFVTGKDAILSYLQCSDQKSAKAPARKGSKKGPASPKEAGTVTPFELNGQGSQNLPFQIVVPPAEGGACRSDENCK
jgi:glutaredoxin